MGIGISLKQFFSKLFFVFGFNLDTIHIMSDNQTCMCYNNNKNIKFIIIVTDLNKFSEEY